jgi:hypothetical protein
MLSFARRTAERKVEGSRLNLDRRDMKNLRSERKKYSGGLCRHCIKNNHGLDAPER